MQVTISACEHLCPKDGMEEFLEVPHLAVINGKLMALCKRCQEESGWPSDHPAVFLNPSQVAKR